MHRFSWRFVGVLLTKVYELRANSKDLYFLINLQSACTGLIELRQLFLTELVQSCANSFKNAKRPAVFWWPHSIFLVVCRFAFQHLRGILFLRIFYGAFFLLVTVMVLAFRNSWNEILWMNWIDKVDKVTL